MSLWYWTTNEIDSIIKIGTKRTSVLLMDVKNLLFSRYEYALKYQFIIFCIESPFFIIIQNLYSYLYKIKKILNSNFKLLACILQHILIYVKSNTPKNPLNFKTFFSRIFNIKKVVKTAKKAFFYFGFCGSLWTRD